MDGRGIGRTTRQLQSLPDGSIFVVSHDAEKHHCRHLLKQIGRHPEALRLLTLEEVKRGDRLRGLPRTTVLDVDHFVYECGMLTAGYREHLRQWQHRYAVPAPT